MRGVAIVAKSLRAALGLERGIHKDGERILRWTWGRMLSNQEQVKARMLELQHS